MSKLRQHQNLVRLFKEAIEEHRLTKKIAIILLRQDRVDEFIRLYRPGATAKGRLFER